jgi:hypothetical protein
MLMQVKHLKLILLKLCEKDAIFGNKPIMIKILIKLMNDRSRV